MEKFAAFVSAFVLSAIALPALASQSPQTQPQIQADHQLLIACHRHNEGQEPSAQ